ncbi:hypothetical protein D9758_012419 [Tetrapyrgos nigripes]|uniref:Uncharacterized protein n=1 Tax=Tetrapyrgos nigripes TaxID=182062 RepID=A0A8H5D842_9AGAR|nr:hypothetical protein D9758_012419 [Tetrapyrgos nigripes]
MGETVGVVWGEGMVEWANANSNSEARSNGYGYETGKVFEGPHPSNPANDPSFPPTSSNWNWNHETGSSWSPYDPSYNPHNHWNNVPLRAGDYLPAKGVEGFEFTSSRLKPKNSKQPTPPSPRCHTLNLTSALTHLRPLLIERYLYMRGRMGGGMGLDSTHTSSERKIGRIELKLVSRGTPQQPLSSPSPSSSTAPPPSEVSCVEVVPKEQQLKLGSICVRGGYFEEKESVDGGMKLERGCGGGLGCCSRFRGGWKSARREGKGEGEGALSKDGNLEKLKVFVEDTLRLEADKDKKAKSEEDDTSTTPTSLSTLLSPFALSHSHPDSDSDSLTLPLPPKIVITYLSRQPSPKRKLDRESHEGLVRALEELVERRNREREERMRMRTKKGNGNGVHLDPHLRPHRDDDDTSFPETDPQNQNQNQNKTKTTDAPPPPPSTSNPNGNSST